MPGNGGGGRARTRRRRRGGRDGDPGRRRAGPEGRWRGRGEEQRVRRHGIVFMVVQFTSETSGSGGHEGSIGGDDGPGVLAEDVAAEGLPGKGGAGVLLAVGDIGVANEVTHGIVPQEEAAHPGRDLELARGVGVPEGGPAGRGEGDHLVAGDFPAEPGEPAVVPPREPSGVGQLDADGEGVDAAAAPETAGAGVPRLEVEGHQLEHLPVAGNDHVGGGPGGPVGEVESGVAAIAAAGVVEHDELRGDEGRLVLGAVNPGNVGADQPMGLDVHGIQVLTVQQSVFLYSLAEEGGQGLHAPTEDVAAEAYLEEIPESGIVVEHGQGHEGADEHHGSQGEHHDGPPGALQPVAAHLGGEQAFLPPLALGFPPEEHLGDAAL